MILPYLLLSQTATPQRTLDAMLAALAKPPSDMIRVTSSENASAGPTYTFVFGRDLLQLSISEVGSIRRGPAERTYLVRGDRFLGYDHIANEFISRKGVPAGGPLAKMTFFLGEIPALYRAGVDSGAMKAALQTFAGLGSWKSIKESGGHHLWVATGKSRVDLHIDSRFLPRSLAVQGSGKRAVYKYSRVSMASMDVGLLKVPANAVSVKVFTEQPGNPKFTDRASANLYSGAVRASFRLVNNSVKVANGSYITFGRSVVSLQPRIWRWWKGRLILDLPKEKRRYSGLFNSADAINKLGNMGISMDPFIRDLMLRRSPIHAYFPPGTSLRKMGSISIRGQKCAILKGDIGNRSVTVFLNSRNHPVQVENVVFGRDGREISRKVVPITIGTAPKINPVPVRKDWIIASFPLR